MAPFAPPLAPLLHFGAMSLIIVRLYLTVSKGKAYAAVSLCRIRLQFYYWLNWWRHGTDCEVIVSRRLKLRCVSRNDRQRIAIIVSVDWK